MWAVVAKLQAEKQIEVISLLLRFIVTLVLLSICAYILAIKADATEIDKNLASVISAGIMGFWLSAPSRGGGGGEAPPLLWRWLR